jgi:hypothetical protein
VKEASDPPDTPEVPDVPAFVSVLNRHGVRYVVIGGYVAQGFVSSPPSHTINTQLLETQLPGRERDQRKRGLVAEESQM